jgi:hypothetical protein
VVTTLLVSSVNSNGKKPTTNEYFQNFCREIVNRHYFIRSASIADNVGHLMATASRHRLVPLITYEDSTRAATQAATSNKFKSKIRELRFSLSRYEKLVRARFQLRMVSSMEHRYNYLDASFHAILF